MEFLVVFTSGDRPAYHQAEDLDEALRFVEHLRNVEGVADARLYRMHEVPLEFRPYFKVEVATGNGVLAGQAIAEG